MASGRGTKMYKVEVTAAGYSFFQDLKRLSVFYDRRCGDG
jgi:hypothetical protein